jgi:hypothetical protein
VLLAWRPGRLGRFELGRFELGRSTLGERSDLLSSIVKRSGPLCRGAGSAATRDRARDMTAWVERLHAMPVLELTGEVSFAAATHLCIELLEAAA